MKKLSKAVILSAGILAGASVLPAESFLVVNAEASGSVKISRTLYQTTSNVNLRAGAGTAFKTSLTIPKGKIMTASEKNGVWIKAAYSYTIKGKSVTKTGWVHSGYVTEYYQNKPIAKTYIFTNKTVKLYSSADLKKKPGYSVGMGNGFYTTLQVINSLGQVWYKVSFNGKSVYIYSGDIVKSTFSAMPKTSFQAKKQTYVYQSYGNIYKKLASIPTGAIVSSQKKVGNWYSIAYKGYTGYVYAGDFAKYVQAPVISYTAIPETIYFTTKGVKLYSLSAAGGQVKEEVSTDTGFASTQKASIGGETFYRVSYKGSSYYLKSKDAAAKDFSSSAPAKFKAIKDTVLYESYGGIYTKLADISQDTVISSSSKIGDWHLASVNGKEGYMYIGDFVPYSSVTETKITETSYLTKGSVTLRKEADDTADPVVVIPDAKIVLASSITSNNWYKVSFSGFTGYVPGKAVSQVRTGDPLINRDGYQFIDLRTQSTVTAKQINDYVNNNFGNFRSASVLSGKGQVFVDTGKKYGINALYLAAHAIHESAYGTSVISLGKNNLFGFGSYDATAYIASYKFGSVEANIEYIARQMKATYLNPNDWRYHGAYLGFSTKDMNNTRINSNSEGMNYYYASDPNWGKGIARHMEAILPYDKAYYAKAVPNTVVPSLPGKPEGSDVFPEGIKAAAKKDLVLNSIKGSTEAVITLKSGSPFILLEKTNDYWVKIQVGSSVFWTDDIKFDVYKNYMTVENLGRTREAVNVRKDPYTTAGNVITTLNMNEYVQLVLKNDSPEKDASNSWYKVKLADGTLGWVSVKYITQELK
ncbi:SH3 domain-containing protein [Peribacillus deserti]|uniref:Peptide-binding protein n=1 Tax=Peribacillus deserti TaxID=673318 RepID=A0A2N5M4Z2_9BACI|nr:SH3 domain-containing protein [Peribacillus deserti]PLT29436.1 peptide-binding protein [Peribacillus deserti]